MDLIKCGELIANLRKEAGYTQAEIAEKLNVTDKAVSKWERGICLPNSDLLPRLSMYLDADIEYILMHGNPYGSNDKWFGEIRVDDIKHDVYGKPLIHYLLSYFMLAGISDVAVLSDEWDYLEKMNLEQYGLNISHYSFHMPKTMIVYGKFILFGANLTRQFNLSLNDAEGIAFKLHDMDIPLLFSHAGSVVSTEKYRQNCSIKRLGRGMLYLPLDSDEERRDAESFIRIYEKYNHVRFTDLNEIAELRGLKPRE